MSICGVLRRNTLPANAKITIVLPSRASTANSTALAATNLLPQPRLLSVADSEVHRLGEGALKGHLLRALAPLLMPGRFPDRLAAGFALSRLVRAPRCADLRGGVPRLGGAALPQGTRPVGHREGPRVARTLRAVLSPRVVRLELSRPSKRAIPRPVLLGAVPGRARRAGVVCQSEADLQRERKS